jgi:hypothetical protein
MAPRSSRQDASSAMAMSTLAHRHVDCRNHPEMALGLMRPLIATSSVASKPSIEKLLISA